MEINATGLAAREYSYAKNTTDQQQTQRAAEKDENTPQTSQVLEPRPVQEADADKQGRIDLYA